MRILKWFSIAFASLALLGFLGALTFFLRESRKSTAQLTKAVADADRDDPNWRMQNLLAHRKVVTEDKNSALVVADALEGIPEDWPKAENAPGLSARQTELSTAYDQLGITPTNRLFDPDTVATLEKELERLADNVQTARSLVGYPSGSSEIVLAPLVTETLLPYTQSTRTCTGCFGPTPWFGRTGETSTARWNLAWQF